MANSQGLSSQGHLMAGSLALERLRQQFILYLDQKEQEVQKRMVTGQAGQTAPAGEGLSAEWS